MIKPLSTLIVLSGVFWMIFSFLATPVYAQDEEESEEAATEEGEGGEEGEAPAAAIYLNLKPQFVVNYGGAGRLKYLKAELSVRLASTDAANAVRNHMPQVRNNLLLLFANQTDESMDSQEGKEKLRRDALEEIAKVIKTEEDLDGVVEVFFNSLIVQK